MTKPAFISALHARRMTGSMESVGEVAGICYKIPALEREDLSRLAAPEVWAGEGQVLYKYTLEDGVVYIVVPTLGNGDMVMEYAELLV